MVAVGAVALVPTLGCDLKQSLLSPQQPGVIGPTSVTTPTGAEALRIGALGLVQGRGSRAAGSTSPTCPMMSDLVTDVWASGDTQSQHNETDQRTMQIQQRRAGLGLHGRPAGARVRDHGDPGAPPVRDAASVGDDRRAVFRARIRGAADVGRLLQRRSVRVDGRRRSDVHAADHQRRRIQARDRAVRHCARARDGDGCGEHRDPSREPDRQGARADRSRELCGGGGAGRRRADQLPVPADLLAHDDELRALLLNGNQASRFVVGDSFAIVNGASSRDQERASVRVGERSAHSSDGSDQQHHEEGIRRQHAVGRPDVCMVRPIRSRCSPASTRG